MLPHCPSAVVIYCIGPSPSPSSFQNDISQIIRKTCSASLETLYHAIKTSSLQHSSITKLQQGTCLTTKLTKSRIWSPAPSRILIGDVLLFFILE